MSTVEATSVPAIFVPKPITFDIASDRIALLAEDYSKLKITGVDDTKGYRAVHEARIHCRDQRIAVDKRREELKSDAIKYGKEVEKLAKPLIQSLEAIEDELHAKEKAIDAEKARLKAIKDEEAKAATQARVDALQAVGDTIAFVLAGALEPAAYEERLAASTAAYKDRLAKEAAEEAERQRLIEEARVQREAELKRLAEQKAEQDKLAAELKQQQEALEAKQREIAAAQQAESDRLAAEAKRLKELAEASQREASLAAIRKQAEIDAKAKLAKEAAAKVEKERKAEERRLAKEAKRPDKEKLEAFAVMLSEMELPNLTDEEAMAALKVVMADNVQAVREVANGMDYEEAE